MENELYHHGILGMKWGLRRYQNKNGSLTSAGKKQYSKKFSEKARLNDKEEIKKTAPKQKMSTGKKVAIGVGVAAGVAVVGAVGYKTYKSIQANKALQAGKELLSSKSLSKDLGKKVTSTATKSVSDLAREAGKKTASIADYIQNTEQSAFNDYMSQHSDEVSSLTNDLLKNNAATLKSMGY